MITRKYPNLSLHTNIHEAVLQTNDCALYHTYTRACVGVQGSTEMYRPDHGHEIHHEAGKERERHQEPATGD